MRACLVCHSCSLEPRFIELGLLPFGHPKAYPLTLHNTGTVAARFYFVAPPKPQESRDGIMLWDDNQPLCPPWLLVSQEEGEVQQGRGFWEGKEGLTRLVGTRLIGGGWGNAAAAGLSAGNIAPALCSCEWWAPKCGQTSKAASPDLPKEQAVHLNSSAFDAPLLGAVLSLPAVPT